MTLPLPTLKDLARLEVERMRQRHEDEILQRGRDSYNDYQAGYADGIVEGRYNYNTDYKLSAKLEEAVHDLAKHWVNFAEPEYQRFIGLLRTDLRPPQNPFGQLSARQMSRNDVVEYVPIKLSLPEMHVAFNILRP